MLASDKVAILKDRAQMLARARAFFADRGILEVDCPCLSSAASIDPYIDLLSTQSRPGEETRYLFSSPEYAMKRLLAQGVGDIYQLSHVFRDDEVGSRHNPEFTMAEWYRIGMSYEEMMSETIDFTLLFLGAQKVEFLTYRQAFQRFAGVDYLTCNEAELIASLKEYGVQPYPSLLSEGKDAILNVILSVVVEPSLKKLKLCVLHDYPASQAALAKTYLKEDEPVAERFEIFFDGIELANGYHELTNAAEQRLRLENANQKRVNEGKKRLPIDERFLIALQEGIPECCGVAVGFDRLMMLRHQTLSIADVLPFAWTEI